MVNTDQSNDTLWKNYIWNQTGDFIQILQRMEDLHHILIPDGMCHDASCLLDRQLRILQLEVNNLQSILSSKSDIFKRLINRSPADNPSKDEH
jgi:hypothetical protein